MKPFNILKKTAKTVGSHRRRAKLSMPRSPLWCVFLGCFFLRVENLDESLGRRNEKVLLPKS